MDRHIDYFGNEVAFAAIEGAHHQFRVTARSRVAVGPAFIPDRTETPAWESMCATLSNRPFGASP